MDTTISERKEQMDNISGGKKKGKNAEDGIRVSYEIKQDAKPGEGKIGSWDAM